MNSIFIIGVNRHPLVVKSPEEKRHCRPYSSIGDDITAFGALETADVVVVIVSIAPAAKTTGANLCVMGDVEAFFR